MCSPVHASLSPHRAVERRARCLLVDALSDSVTHTSTLLISALSSSVPPRAPPTKCRPVLGPSVVRLRCPQPPTTFTEPSSALSSLPSLFPSRSATLSMVRSTLRSSGAPLQSWSAQPPSVFAASEVDVEEGEGDEQLRFFPLLPSAFTSSLLLHQWQPLLLPTSAGRVLLTRDDAFPHQRVVELTCEAGKVEGVGIQFPAQQHFIGSPLPIINLQLKHVCPHTVHPPHSTRPHLPLCIPHSPSTVLLRVALPGLRAV